MVENGSEKLKEERNERICKIKVRRGEGKSQRIEVKNCRKIKCD